MSNYIGLLIGSAEPDNGLGYSRAEGTFDETIVFPTAQTDYGLITALALYDSPEGGEPIEIVELPKPVDIGQGIIPIVRDKALLRGVDVTARVTVHANELLNL